MKQLTIFCGGRSTEHDISFLSAQNIIQSIDQSSYEITVIYISPTSGWFRLCSDQAWDLLLAGPDLSQRDHFEPVGVVFDDPKFPWISLLDPTQRYAADVIFPVLHGTYGEDGCIQGLFALLDIPFVGADTLVSAILMNKMRTKQILQAKGIACTPFQAWSKGADYLPEAVLGFREMGGDVFVKAASLGSAVGVYHVTEESEIEAAFERVLALDEWVLMEPAMTGREIETAVLGNRHDWQVAGPGEIIKHKRFYDYKAKYHDDEGAASPVARADVTEAEKAKILPVARAVAEAVDCEGMCRVDGFLTEEGFVINEVNTIPGFTQISLYPQMWVEAGKSIPELVGDLLQLAFDRHERQQKLQRVYGGG